MTNFLSKLFKKKYEVTLKYKNFTDSDNYSFVCIELYLSANQFNRINQDIGLHLKKKWGNAKSFYFEETLRVEPVLNKRQEQRFLKDCLRLLKKC